MFSFLPAGKKKKESFFFFFFRYVNLNFLLECQCGLNCVLQRKLSHLDLVPINVILFAHRVFADISYGYIGLEGAPNKALSGEGELETDRDRKDRWKAE